MSNRIYTRIEVPFQFPSVEPLKQELIYMMFKVENFTDLMDCHCVASSISRNGVLIYSAQSVLS